MTDKQKKELFRLLRIGQRIIKTAVAVLICLIINTLRGQRGEHMSAEAAITAIICIQPYIRDTRYSGLNRFIGSLIGAEWALVILLLLVEVPALGKNLIVLYCIMALGVVLSLYTPLVMRLPDASGLAAIIFVCIITVYPDIEDPIYNAVLRMVDVLIGAIVAIFVNGFRLPRRKNKNGVFFVRTKDLPLNQVGLYGLLRLMKYEWK